MTTVLANLDAAASAASSALDSAKAAELAAYTVSFSKVQFEGPPMLLSPLKEDVQLARDVRRGEF